MSRAIDGLIGIALYLVIGLLTHWLALGRTFVWGDVLTWAVILGWPLVWGFWIAVIMLVVGVILFFWGAL